jgi:hypothetical protein
VSQDARSPRWGPGFLRLNAWPYRAEYVAATVALLVYLVVGRGLVAQDLGVAGALATLFWFLFPDLAAFLPIGAAARGPGGWPSWGATLYNVVHSLLVWGALFALWTLVAHGPPWPLLGWALHITLDRAAGYHLRAGGRPDRANA